MMFKYLRLSAIIFAMAWLESLNALQAQITTWDQLYNAFQNGGTITLTQNITYSGSKGAIVVPSGKNVTLDLNGHTVDRHLDAGAAVPKGNVFRISSNATLTIKDSSKDAENPFGKGVITGGNAGGTPDKYGGAIYCEGNLFIYGGTIKGNLSKDSGGAVYLKSGNMTVSGAAFLNNSTPLHGGAIFVCQETTLNVSNVGGDDTKTLFLSNNAGACGGAICNEGTTTISGGEFNSNVGQWGGGIYNIKTLNISGGHYLGNQASAIQNQDFVLFDLTGNPLFERNNADYGAAIQFQSWSSGHANECYIKGGTFRNNKAVGGGALTVRCNPSFINLKISGGLFEENEAVFGGVIDITGGGEVTVTGGSFLSNKATGSSSNSADGGVFKNNGILTISNGVFENNTADFGSCVYQNGTMNLSGNPAFGTNDDVYLRTDKVITKGGDIASTVLVPVAVQNEINYRDILITSTDHPVELADLARIDMRLLNVNSPILHAEFTASDAVTHTPVIELFAILWTDYVTKFADVPENTYLTDDDGNVTLKSKEALAWLISVVNGLNGQTANAMSGKTVTLTENVDMAEHIWVAIGSGDKSFKGIFTSNGSTIKGLVTTADYGTPGLFGKVDGGTIKNAFVEGCEFVTARKGYYGIIADTITGSATVHSSEVMGRLEATHANDNIGGVVGLASGSSEIHSVISFASLNGTEKGGIVNKLDGSSLKNSYAIFSTFTTGKELISTNNGGTVANCYYVNGDERKLSDGATFTIPVAYGYGISGCMVNSERMTDRLNAWVGNSETYATWAQPFTAGINGDSPVLKLKDFNTMASQTTTAPYLYYGDMDAQIASNAYTTMLFYGQKDNSTANYSGDNLFIDPDAALKHNGTLKVNAGVVFDNSDHSGFAGGAYDWHMFSTPLTDAPLGIDYSGYIPAGSVYGTPSQVNFTNADGYFPTDTPYGSWDFYCFSEPFSSWINYKRNTDDHYDTYTGHNITADEFSNEVNLIAGKGYLAAIDRETLIQAKGTLNNANVKVPVTYQGHHVTGSNFIGNPYHAYLDFDKFCAYSSNSGILESSSYSMLDADYQGYVSYAVGASDNPDQGTRYIHPHQGFLVKVTQAGELHFTPDMAVVNQTSSYRETQVNYPLVNLFATDSEGIREIATVELGRPENGGALKIEGMQMGKCTMSISNQGKRYGIAFIESKPEEVAIHFQATESGDFTMKWNTHNGTFSYLHLIDNLTGMDIDCLSQSEYKFTASTSDYASRFKLKFEFTGVEENQEASAGSSSFAFFHQGNLVVNGQGSLYLIDLNGRILMTKNLGESQSTVVLPEVPEGLYLLRLVDDSNAKTQKIIIK